MEDFRPVLACVQAAIKGEFIGQPAEMFNVIHFQTATAEPTATDIDNVLTVVKNWCQSVYSVNFSADLRITEVRVQSLFASAAPFAFATVSNQGTQTSLDELAHAPLILLHGGISDRHQAGRFYAFSPGGTQPQTGYNDAYYANMVAALSNLSTNALFAGVALAVASRDAGVCHRVTSIGHSNRLTEQKRRRLGFGR